MTSLYPLLALVLLYYVFTTWTRRTRCDYCGESGNRHGQDCPWDYLNREERE